MFCNNCGAQLPDGSKFCTNCGSTLQTNPTLSQSAPPPPTPPQDPAPKKKHTTAIIVAIVSVIVVVGIAVTVAVTVGGSDKNKDNNNDNIEATPSSSVVNESNPDVNKSENSIINLPEDFAVDTESNNTVPLKDLEIIQPNGDVWNMPADEYGNSIDISAGYCYETGVIKDFVMSFEINKGSPDYNTLLSDFETINNSLKALNDSEIVSGFIKEDNTVTLVVSISGLNKADRAVRVELAEEIIGVSADIETKAFYFSDVDAELSALGFED